MPYGEMNRIKNIFLPVAFLAVVSFISHFLFFRQFGIYEDDYYNIPPYLNMTFSSLFEIIKISTTNWLQGRPLSFMPYFFTMFGYKIAGLPGLYFIAFMIVTVNSVLMYFILKEIFPKQDFIAMAGALMFCLFPSDTTKTLLIHAYVLQMSMMFFLAAALLYLKNFKILSYAVIILSLFSYESVFILFFAMPFLNYGKKKILKEIVLNTFILILFLIFSFLFRKYSGESRIEELSGNFFNYISKSFIAMFYGPLMNLYLFLRAPLIPVKNINMTIAVSFIAFVILFFFIFKSFKIRTNGSDDNSISQIKKNIFFKYNSDEDVFKAAKLIPVSLLFFSLGYALSFTHYPPTAVAGRLTSVHLAATFGGSMLTGLLFYLIYRISISDKTKFISLIVVSAYFSLLVCYGLVIQNDFAKSRIYQKNFWSKIISLCPDMKDSTLIIVLQDKENRLPATTYIGSNSWADPIIPGRLFSFPENYKLPPRVFVFNKDFENRTLIENDTLKWKVPESTSFAHTEILPDSNVILIYTDKENLMKRTEADSINLKGITLHLKMKNEDLVSGYKKNLIYKILLETEN